MERGQQGVGWGWGGSSLQQGRGRKCGDTGVAGSAGRSLLAALAPEAQKVRGQQSPGARILEQSTCSHSQPCASLAGLGLLKCAVGRKVVPTYQLRPGYAGRVS